MSIPTYDCTSIKKTEYVTGEQLENGEVEEGIYQLKGANDSFIVLSKRASTTVAFYWEKKDEWGGSIQPIQSALPSGQQGGARTSKFIRCPDKKLFMEIR